jgi:hypothetical protein
MAFPSIVTLLSDFGLQDVYVAVMKGAIASINPRIAAIDLTHAIPPQDLYAARFQLLNAVLYFPPSTVHVAVVDPGVGSQRRGVAITTERGYFVGPDNGIFSGILARVPPQAVVELTNPDYWRYATPSATFHGRDIFAPVAAHLASGIPLAELGTAIAPNSLISLPVLPGKATASGWEGSVQAIDRFGNVVTTIPGEAVPDTDWVAIAKNVTIPAARTYSDVPAQVLVALVGSHGWVELAVNGGSAGEALGLKYGDRVTVHQRRA